jgi:bifunctional DNA-binding transcriptional regulator/antitoxin component of YhaV-PrlF toxin-antitoxin module
MSQLISINQVVYPTSKWQITIPQKVREKVGLSLTTPLNVSSWAGKVLVTPIKQAVAEDIWSEEKRAKLLRVLAQTRGMWTNNKDGLSRIRKQRKIDIEEVKRMKKSW